MINNTMNKLAIFSLSIIFLLAPLTEVLGANLSVRPFLIDETIEPRQYLQKDVTITNETNNRLNVYATVNEITVDTDGEIKEFVSPIMTDRTNTVTSWVEITRGRIEIEPGETATVPLGFRVHPSAKPGQYHVFIGFGAASKRFQAEAAALSGELNGVIVQLTIEDKSTEYLRIAGFLVDRFVTSDDDKQVQIQLENLGDVSATPEGEIVFFNSTGEELEAIPFNTEQITIPPGETVIITSEIPFGNELGRFKANLSLQYGSKQKASLYDTAQFFMMPLHIILLMLLVAILLALIIFLMLYRALSYRDEQEEGAVLPLFVRDGHGAEPKDHDIDLSTKE
jgi:hypothetical protein